MTTLIARPTKPTPRHGGGWELNTSALEGKPFVCLYRVSTQGQKHSGLGLEVQLNGCRDYAARNGFIISEFEEVVSGRAHERPVFNQAVLLCRKNRAALLVYKLDRVSRTLQAVPDLMRQDVEVVVSTMPSATPIMLCMLAALATDEAQRISARTKDALAARRRRLGPPAVRQVMPPSVNAAGRLTRSFRSLALSRNYRDAARRNAARGLSLRKNADAIMLEYPLSGRVNHMRVKAWIADTRDAQDYEDPLNIKRQLASKEMKILSKKKTDDAPLRIQQEHGGP